MVDASHAPAEPLLGYCLAEYHQRVGLRPRRSAIPSASAFSPRSRAKIRKADQASRHLEVRQLLHAHGRNASLPVVFLRHSRALASVAKLDLTFGVTPYFPVQSSRLRPVTGSAGRAQRFREIHLAAHAAGLVQPDAGYRFAQPNRLVCSSALTSGCGSAGSISAERS
jgi:hypothetical protein